MITATVAKFSCHTVDEFGPSQRIKLGAVYEPPGGDNEENARFYAASPYGVLELTVDNPAVHGFFERGESYIVTIQKAARR